MQERKRLNKELARLREELAEKEARKADRMELLEMEHQINVMKLKKEAEDKRAEKNKKRLEDERKEAEKMLAQAKEEAKKFDDGIPLTSAERESMGELPEQNFPEEASARWEPARLRRWLYVSLSLFPRGLLPRAD